MKRLMEEYDNYALSISVTTRDPRPGEEDGVSYFFRTEEEFDRMVEEDAFLEYARYVKHSYGTPKAYVEEQLDAGKDVLLEIEIQGALQVKEKRPDTLLVFITPPSLGVLTVNAFTCATDILIPTTAGIFATAGISQLNETVTSVQKYCNPAVKVRGILFTRFNPRANISRQMKELAEQLGEYISAPIYKTYIRSAVVVEEAQANSQDIFDYAGKSTVAEDYRAFIEEFLKGVNA